jgi:hypothetical protein
MNLNSIDQLQRSLPDGQIWPKGKHCIWKLCKSTTGAIPGLPGSVGSTIATNGIFVLVERPNGTVGFYHKDFFVKEKQKKATAAKQVSVDWSEFNL